MGIQTIFDGGVASNTTINANGFQNINEGGIGDEITQRLKALESANRMEENIYDLQKEYDLDEYDNMGFNVEEEEEFEAIDEGEA